MDVAADLAAAAALSLMLHTLLERGSGGAFAWACIAVNVVAQDVSSNEP